MQLPSPADSGDASSSLPPPLDGNLLIDLSPLPTMVLSPSCCITRVSNRFLDSWAVTRQDCVGQQLLSFIDRQLRPAGSAAILYLSATIDAAVAARAERTTKQITTVNATSWRARVLPIFNGPELLATVLEWQEGSAPLIEEEIVRPGLSTDEAFRILVQAVKDYAIFLLDTSGHIASWNRGAELLKGYRRDEIIGKHFSVFYGADDLAVRKPELELEICLREGRVEDEGWRYKKDGTRFWANVIITAVYKDGVHVGFGKVTRDLTERKTSESRLISAYEESEKLKSDFLANMSHEIRTPMHGMLSACSLLLDTPLTDRQKDIVYIMDESGQVLLQVINDILDYSKLASGSFSITSDIVGITSVITSVVRSVQTTMRSPVHFELFLAPELPKSVQGDPLRYRQIVHNLVNNAGKFTERGSIRIQASVQSEDEDSYVVLTEVTDTGIGIPDAASANLFTPFTQFDATTTKRFKGTGLGLSIAKSLAELMGGRIGYRSNPERQGSIFWFTARFKKIKSLEQINAWKSTYSRGEDVHQLAVGTPSPELVAELGRAASTKSLLLAEDNIINQKVMIGMLRSIGFKNVALAANGAEAVKMVRGKPAAYDLVLMDINMPILDGHKASVQIREAGIRVPIVAMTAYALKGDKERCLEHGMDDYVPKPVQKQHLIKVLCQWLLTEKDYRVTTSEDFAKASLLELRKIQQQPPAFKQFPKSLLPLPPIQVQVLAPKPPSVGPVSEPEARTGVSEPNGGQETQRLDSPIRVAVPLPNGVQEGKGSEVQAETKPQPKPAKPLEKVEKLSQDLTPPPSLTDIPVPVPAQQDSQQTRAGLASEGQPEASPKEMQAEINTTHVPLGAQQQQHPLPQSNRVIHESLAEGRSPTPPTSPTQPDVPQGVEQQI